VQKEGFTPDPTSDNQIKEEKQAHSLDKTTLSLRGISHEFFLDSEIAETHTLSNNEQINYLKLSKNCICVLSRNYFPTTSFFLV